MKGLSRTMCLQFYWLNRFSNQYFPKIIEAKYFVSFFDLKKISRIQLSTFEKTCSWVSTYMQHLHFYRMVCIRWSVMDLCRASADWWYRTSVFMSKIPWSFDCWKESVNLWHSRPMGSKLSLIASSVWQHRTGLK